MNSCDAIQSRVSFLVRINALPLDDRATMMSVGFEPTLPMGIGFQVQRIRPLCQDTFKCYFYKEVTKPECHKTGARRRPFAYKANALLTELLRQYVFLLYRRNKPDTSLTTPCLYIYTTTTLYLHIWTLPKSNRRLLHAKQKFYH